jgi:hypothetical protein
MPFQKTIAQSGMAVRADVISCEDSSLNLVECKAFSVEVNTDDLVVRQRVDGGCVNPMIVHIEGLH